MRCIFIFPSKKKLEFRLETNQTKQAKDSSNLDESQIADWIESMCHFICKLASFFGSFTSALVYSTRYITCHTTMKKINVEDLTNLVHLSCVSKITFFLSLDKKKNQTKTNKFKNSKKPCF